MGSLRLEAVSGLRVWVFLLNSECALNKGLGFRASTLRPETACVRPQGGGSPQYRVGACVLLQSCCVRLMVMLIRLLYGSCWSC